MPHDPSLDDRLGEFFTGHDAAPTGAGVDAAIRSGRNRQRRRLGASVCTVALVAGIGGMMAMDFFAEDPVTTQLEVASDAAPETVETAVETAVENDIAPDDTGNLEDPPSTDVQAASFTWEVSEGADSSESQLGYAEFLATDSDGVLYAVSTEPGDPNDPGAWQRQQEAEYAATGYWSGPKQVLYRNEGSGWDITYQSDQLTMRGLTTVGTDLYTVGTAASASPRFERDPGEVVIAKSTDGGTTWTNQQVGPDLQDLQAKANVGWVGGQIASGPGFIVATTTVSAYVDFWQNIPNGEFQESRVTDTGVELMGFSDQAVDDIIVLCPATDEIDPTTSQFQEALWDCRNELHDEAVGTSDALQEFEETLNQIYQTELVVIDFFSFADLGVDPLVAPYASGYGNMQVWLSTGEAFTEASLPPFTGEIQLIETGTSVIAMTTEWNSATPVTTLYETTDGSNWSVKEIASANEYAHYPPITVANKLIQITGFEAETPTPQLVTTNGDGSSTTIDIASLAGVAPGEIVEVGITASSNELGAVMVNLWKDPFFDNYAEFVSGDHTVRIIDNEGRVEIRDTTGAVVGTLDSIWNVYEQSYLYAEGEVYEEPAEELAFEELVSEDYAGDGPYCFDAPVTLDDGSEITISTCDVDNAMSSVYETGNTNRLVLLTTSDGVTWSATDLNALAGEPLNWISTMYVIGTEITMQSSIWDETTGNNRLITIIGQAS